MNWVIPTLEFTWFVIMTMAAFFGLRCFDEIGSNPKKQKKFKIVAISCYVISAIILVIIIVLFKNSIPETIVYAG